MAIPMLGGLIWRSQWHAPGEGPYSILAKILHANRLRQRYFKDAFYLGSPGGPNLLFPYTRHSIDLAAKPLVGLISDSCIGNLAPGVYRILAGDETLRYCRACMATGFQAAIAQIDGLDACPIHNEPHLNFCIGCGSKTPPYHLGANERLPSFSCWKCRAPYGGSASIEVKCDIWKPPDGVHRLYPIHEWLTKICDRSHINWPSLAGWDSTKLVDSECEAHRRRAIFSIFRSLVSDSPFPDPLIEPEITYFGPFLIPRNQPEFWDEANLYTCEFVFSERAAINFDDYRDSFRMPSFGIPVPVDPMVPPRIHAQVIWGAQFADFMHTFRPTNSSKVTNLSACINLGEHKFWLKLGVADTSFTKSVCFATWLAAERIAVEWNRLLVEFSNMSGSQRDLCWRTACSRWQHRLGFWRKNGYFPVAAITVGDLSSGDSYVKLAVA